MPLLEFKCDKGHITERAVALRSPEAKKEEICCPACLKEGKVESAFLIFSRTAPPVFVEGCGGFYKPTR
jgi:hypothetical protein